jgi:hypothetical protein
MSNDAYYADELIKSIREGIEIAKNAGDAAREAMTASRQHAGIASDHFMAAKDANRAGDSTKANSHVKAAFAHDLASKKYDDAASSFYSNKEEDGNKAMGAAGKQAEKAHAATMNLRGAC